MTLVDSRAGIAVTVREVTAELGVPLTDAEIWPTIGIPLQDALRQWLTEDQVEAAMTAYRDRYPTTGVPITTVLPGAAAALDAVRALGGRTAVISAKIESAVHQVLDQVGLTADIVVGDRFAEGKAVVLAELGSQVYVGDHPGD